MGRTVTVCIYSPLQALAYVQKRQQFRRPPIRKLIYPGPYDRETNMEDPRLKKAEEALGEGTFERAVEVLDEYLSERSEDIRALYLRCYAEIALSDFEGARLTCDQIKAIDSNSFEYHSSMGAVITDDPSTLMEPGLLRRAIQHMERALEITQKNTKQGPEQVSGQLSNLANARHRLFLCRRMFEEVAPSQALHAISKALTLFDAALDVWTDNVEAWVNKGNLLDEAGRYVESLECYHEALRRKPDHDMALGNYGLAVGRLAVNLPSDYGKACAIEAGYFLTAALRRREFRHRYETDDSLRNWIDSFLALRDFEDAEAVVAHLLTHSEDGGALPTSLGAIRTDNLPRAVKEIARRLGIQLGFTDTTLLKTPSQEDWVNLPSFLDDSTLPEADLRLFLISLFDRYRTALNQFVLAFTHVPDFLALSQPGRENSPQYSMNGEMLKESAKNAVDLLDSVAYFLAEIGGYHSERITFSGPNSVFSRTSVLGDTLDSNYLFAIASLSDDVNRGVYARLDDVRNSITHEYFLLHGRGETFAKDLSLSVKHYAEIGEFTDLAVTSLRTARAAILYLILYILEEKKEES